MLESKSEPESKSERVLKYINSRTKVHLENLNELFSCSHNAIGTDSIRINRSINKKQVDYQNIIDECYNRWVMYNSNIIV